MLRAMDEDQSLSMEVGGRVGSVLVHRRQRQRQRQRPTRGRPRRPTAAADNNPAGEARQLSRVGPPSRCKATADQLQAATTSTRPRTINTENYQSSVARHLTENKACAMCYDDLCLRVLWVGRAKWCLEVLEALFIRSRTPSLCMQKNSVTALKLFGSSSN